MYFRGFFSVCIEDASSTIRDLDSWHMLQIRRRGGIQNFNDVSNTITKETTNSSNQKLVFFTDLQLIVQQCGWIFIGNFALGNKLVEYSGRMQEISIFIDIRLKAKGSFGGNVYSPTERQVANVISYHCFMDLKATRN